MLISTTSSLEAVWEECHERLAAREELFREARTSQKNYNPHL